MGLDFNYGDAHFSYGGFHNFRTELANLANLPDLDNMEGFRGAIKWNLYKDDIIPLLRHSDCDGELTVKECLQIIPRLSKLIDPLSDEDYVKFKGKQLIESMEEAVENKDSLRFQ